MKTIDINMREHKDIGKKSDIVFASMMIGVSLGGIVGSGSGAFAGAVIGILIGLFLASNG